MQLLQIAFNFQLFATTSVVRASDIKVKETTSDGMMNNVYMFVFEAESNIMCQ